MRIVIPLVVLALVAPSAFAEDDIAGTEPVDGSLLCGRTLVFARGGCALEAPEGFSWRLNPGMTKKHSEVTMFLCQDAKQSTVFMVQVYDRHFAPLDAKGVREFLEGARHSMEAQGWKFLASSAEPARIPLDGHVHRFTVKLLRKDGEILFWHGYVITRGRMYCLSSMQLESSERMEFRQFVESFTLIEPLSDRLVRHVLGVTVTRIRGVGPCLLARRR